MFKIDGKEIPQQAGLITKVYLCSNCSMIDGCNATEHRNNGYCYIYDTKNNTIEDMMQTNIIL